LSQPSLAIENNENNINKISSKVNFTDKDEPTPVMQFLRKAKKTAAYDEKDGLWGYDKEWKIFGLSENGFNELNRQHQTGHAKYQPTNKDRSYKKDVPDNAVMYQILEKNWNNTWTWTESSTAPKCPTCLSVVNGFKVHPPTSDYVNWSQPINKLPQYLLMIDSNMKLDKLRKYTAAFEEEILKWKAINLSCDLKDIGSKKYNKTYTTQHKIGESHSQYGKVEHFKDVQYTRAAFGPCYFTCTRCTNDYPQGKDPCLDHNIRPNISITQTDSERIMTLENTSNLVPPCRKPQLKGFLLEIWNSSKPQSNQWDHTLEEMWKVARQLDLEKCGIEPKDIIYKVKSGDWCVIF
jgi:hypothetical protein